MFPRDGLAGCVKILDCGSQGACRHYGRSLLNAGYMAFGRMNGYEYAW